MNPLKDALEIHPGRPAWKRESKHRFCGAKGWERMESRGKNWYSPSSAGQETKGGKRGRADSGVGRRKWGGPPGLPLTKKRGSGIQIVKK